MDWQCRLCSPAQGCMWPSACIYHKNTHFQKALANVDKHVKAELAKQNCADEVVTYNP